MNSRPSSRRDALQSLSPHSTTNAGLWLEKGLPNVEEGGPGRQKLLLELGTIRVPGDYSRYFQRWQDSIQHLEPCTQIAEATVQGRMAVGLGAESVLETAITLHRTYGVPFIPGSALKGLAAAAAHKHLANSDWKKTGEDGKPGPAHQILFGDQESSGYVTFHDALWIPEGEELPLDLDVMTVHHPEYYRGDDVPPADWDSPNPVAFITARGRYLLAVTGPDKEWTKAAMDILTEALQNDGIGAKTAAGYGRMSVPQEPEPEKINWEPRIKGLHFGIAGDVVPRLLQQLQGAERQRAAKAMIARLDRATLRGRQHRDRKWVKELFEAEAE